MCMFYMFVLLRNTLYSLQLLFIGLLRPLFELVTWDHVYIFSRFLCFNQLTQVTPIIFMLLLGRKKTLSKVVCLFFRWIIHGHTLQCRWLYKRLHAQSCHGALWRESVLATPNQVSLNVWRGRYLLSFWWPNLHPETRLMDV